jgi:2-polyprenyl-6-hydroxyphenyl methylase/3-demethylubiquinone-9 3-methyltransferase
LGCGYGRALAPAAARARLVVGVDTSVASLRYGAGLYGGDRGLAWLAMDASRLGFKDDSFDVLFAIQNAVSSFRLAPLALVREAVRVTRPAGVALFSSYAPAFWPERLAWFEAQAREGLVGEIDYEKTRPGVIVCRDGFTATTFSSDEFRALARELRVNVTVEEVDASSVFAAFHKV